MKTAALVLGGAVVAAWAIRRAADARALPDEAVAGAEDAPVFTDATGEGYTDTGPDGTTVLDYINVWGAMERQIDSGQTAQALADGNVAAFLAMIAASEGTARAADPYRVCYGYRHTISDLSDHPAVTGEWRGESLANLGPDYAGKVSTAAGRYQIIRPTWLAAKRALGLQDFGPESQDAACVWLIKRRGALDAVRAGELERAIGLCRQEWASLPGAGYGQPERKMAALSAAYTQAGGILA